MRPLVCPAFRIERCVCEVKFLGQGSFLVWGGGGGGGNISTSFLDDILAACLLRYNAFAVVSEVEEKPARLIRSSFKAMAKVG